jgi:hypothetical protein
MNTFKQRARELRNLYGTDPWGVRPGTTARGRLRRPNPATRLHVAEGSDALLVAFSGVAGDFAMPLFEFSALTASMPVTRVFVRDLRQAWYHRGLERRDKTLLGAADVLRELVAAQKPRRLVMTGASAGGYAALVFGTLLGADVVLCFSPQTLLEPEQLEQIDDHRWDANLKPLAAAGWLDRRWTDLREALPMHQHADTRYEVFFGNSDRSDRLHAERLVGLAGMHHHRMPESGHFVVRKMRESGALERVLRDALREAAAPSARH